MTLLVGGLVALAAWSALDPGGRRARPVAGGSPAARTPLGGRPTAGPGRSWPWGRRRRGEAEAVRLVVAQVGALLRAGRSPAAAWAAVTGAPADAAGAPRVAALAPHVGGEPTARAVVAACRLAAEVGAPLATVLDEVAAAVAADAEARAERDAALAGPRATTRVLLWLPAVGVVLGYVLGADPVASALDGGVGTLGVLTGVLLLLAGRTWSAKLVDRARAVGQEPT
ncbi:type II secretion system F family protein [Cellulosimicrobium marinum]|uniref:type II secretion system F family protein n=1 Tax=Cellulosimicrobium marinum TaxID=1638992 RepID=UPI001E367781|nr:type II secretion system F family protein [Cellulosimicrobium marinum]MCB7135251.1 hypothetical protein [Cellulosimicrobium marinum]